MEAGQVSARLDEGRSGLDGDDAIGDEAAHRDTVARDVVQAIEPHD